LVGADVLGDATGLARTDLRLADRVQQAGLAVVDVAHDGDDRRARATVLVVLVGELGIEVDVELLEQLALLVLRGDDLDLVAELLAEQAEGDLVQRLGRGGHLAHGEEDRDQRCGVDVDAIGEIGQRGAAAQTDRLAVAARDRDAARRGSLLLFELLALRTLRLARAGGLAAATEGTLGAAATTAAAGTAAADRTAGTTARARASATTAAAAALVGVGQAAAGELTHDARGGHARATARTRCTTGTGRAALAGGTAGGLLGAAGTRRALTGAGHALRAGEGVVPGTGTARTGTALARLAAGTGHALRAGEGVVARTGAPRARRGTLTARLRGGDRLLGTRLRGGRRGSRLRGR